MKHHLLATTALLLLLLTPNAAFAWARPGHEAIAAIAEANLLPTAKAAIEKYLEGRSIVYYCWWMDLVRHTDEYGHTSTWHMAKVDRDFRYTSETAGPKGDAIAALETSIAALRNHKAMPPADVAFHIKIILHLVGDMHCPVHVDYETIRSSYRVSLGGTIVSYHEIWDSVVLGNWGYVEWAHQMNRLPKEKIAAITAGTPREWFHQIALDCRIIHEWAKPNDKIGEKPHDKGYRDFLIKAYPLAQSQIQKAGYRLAAVLNELFKQ